MFLGGWGQKSPRNLIYETTNIIFPGQTPPPMSTHPRDKICAHTRLLKKTLPRVRMTRSPKDRARLKKDVSNQKESLRTHTHTCPLRGACVRVVCSSLVRILLLLLEFNPFGIKFFESKKNSSQRNPEGISARKKNFSDAEEFKHEGIQFD